MKIISMEHISKGYGHRSLLSRTSFFSCMTGTRPCCCGWDLRTLMPPPVSSAEDRKSMLEVKMERWVYLEEPAEKIARENSL